MSEVDDTTLAESEFMNALIIYICIYTDTPSRIHIPCNIGHYLLPNTVNHFDNINIEPSLVITTEFKMGKQIGLPFWTNIKETV